MGKTFLDYLASRISKALKYSHSNPLGTISILAYSFFFSLFGMFMITSNLMFLLIGLGIVCEYVLYIVSYIIYYDYKTWKKEKQQCQA